MKLYSLNAIAKEAVAQYPNNIDMAKAYARLLVRERHYGQIIESAMDKAAKAVGKMMQSTSL